MRRTPPEAENDPRRPRPTSPSIAFVRRDVEQSIRHRFEQQVLAHAERLAVKTSEHALTYEDLNRLGRGDFESVAVSAVRHHAGRRGS